MQLYWNVILVYTTYINTIHLNYTKCASNNSTAIHMLGHEGKSSVFFFKEKDKLMLKKDKNAQNHTKNRDIFNQF